MKAKYQMETIKRFFQAILRVLFYEPSPTSEHQTEGETAPRTYFR